MGIFRALITPTIREIKPRSVGNQMLLWLFTAREQLNKQMVQTINVAHAIFVSDCGAARHTGTVRILLFRTGICANRH